MTDLTEQWRKGELPEGVYYVTYYKNDTPEVDIYRQIFSLHNKPIKNFIINQVTKVLAPVPSYEEWKEKLRALDAAYETIKMEDETINRLVCSGKQCNYKNAKLKQQLAIAVEALKIYADKTSWDNNYEVCWGIEIKKFDNGECEDGEFYAEQALQEIKELENEL